jgi:hypothetical protein
MQELDSMKNNQFEIAVDGKVVNEKITIKDKTLEGKKNHLKYHKKQY